MAVEVTAGDDTPPTPKKKTAKHKRRKTVRRKKSNRGDSADRDGQPPAVQVDVGDVARAKGPPDRDATTPNGQPTGAKPSNTQDTAGSREDADDPAASAKGAAKAAKTKRSRSKKKRSQSTESRKSGRKRKKAKGTKGPGPGETGSVPSGRTDAPQPTAEKGKPESDESALAALLSDTDEAATATTEAPGRQSGRGKSRRGRRGRGRGGAAKRVVEEGAPEEKEKAAPAAPFQDASPPSPGAREMVINVSAGHECRIAVLHDGRLEELFIERTSAQSHVGNIYKGRVTNVESSIQAAFIDFGLPKNGFLHISDVQPQYFPNHAGQTEDVGRKIPRHARPPIQKCFRRGQEVIVQVTKEGVGTKGPTLTTYLSIPGRFLVMMPGMSRHGVSRKIEDDAVRRQMRDMLSELDLPSGMGFILRTAGLDRSKRDLQRDLNYLIRLWKTVVDRVKRQPAPTELYQESDLVTRTIRDVYTSDFARVIIDDAQVVNKAREFLQIAMPRSKPVIELYSDREPLFHRLGIEEEIERIHSRHVPLRSGGSLVIDSTEALVAIDVNSGRFRSVADAEETAYQINLEAAEEIARQLRLRDLGGLIVCDFIDMRQDRHKRAVERALRDGLKNHKERARILRMSAFGLIEMTRQRQGPSYKRNVFFDCPHCHGAGVVKMPESVILDVIRLVQLAIHNDQVHRVSITVAPDVAFEILNRKRALINDIETETGKSIVIRGEESFTSDQIECQCEDMRGRPIIIGRPGLANGRPDSQKSRTR